jgi:hypothetical protein
MICLRIHLYGGVTVPLPGLVIWKQFGLCLCLKKSSTSSEPVSALSCCRIWTLDTDSLNDTGASGGHSDTGPLEPLMCESGVQVPLEEWHNSSTDFNPEQSQQLSSSASKLPFIFKIHPQHKTQSNIWYFLCPMKGRRESNINVGFPCIHVF